MSFETVTIGPCTLIRGDCLEVLPTLAPGSVDAGMVTDPPFFQPATHYCPTRDDGAPVRIAADLSILEHFFRSFIAAARPALSPQASAYVCCDGQSYHMAFLGMYPHFKYVRPLIWDKIVSYNGYTWRHQHELIAWGEGRDAERVPTGDGDVIQCRAVAVDDRSHPAEKPVELFVRMVSKLPSGTVLDPFMGSGTTGVACIEADRSFVGIELDPDYFAKSCERIRKAWKLERSKLNLEPETRMVQRELENIQ